MHTPRFSARSPCRLDLPAAADDRSCLLLPLYSLYQVLLTWICAAYTSLVGVGAAARVGCPFDRVRPLCAGDHPVHCHDTQIAQLPRQSRRDAPPRGTATLMKAFVASDLSDGRSSSRLPRRTRTVDAGDPERPSPDVPRTTLTRPRRVRSVEAALHPLVIANDVGHRKRAAVPGLAQGVRPTPASPATAQSSIVHAVNASHHPGCLAQIPLRSWSGGQSVATREGRRLVPHQIRP